MRTSSPIRLAIVGEAHLAARYAALIRRIPGAVLNRAETTVAGLIDAQGEPFDAAVLDPAAAIDADQVATLASRGKHLLVSQPARESIEPLPNEYQSGDAVLMIGTPLRFHPAVAAVRESLTSGELGSPGLLRLHCWESGGATIARQIAGVLDLACWCFAGVPQSVFSICRDIRGPADYQQVHCGFAGDGMAVIDIATGLPDGDSYRSLSLIGASGAAYADDHHNMQLLYRGDRPAAARTDGATGIQLAQLCEFVVAIQNRRVPLVDAAAWKMTLLVAAAVADSAATGQVAQWQGDRYELV